MGCSRTWFPGVVDAGTGAFQGESLLSWLHPRTFLISHRNPGAAPRFKSGFPKAQPNTSAAKPTQWKRERCKRYKLMIWGTTEASPHPSHTSLWMPFFPDPHFRRKPTQNVSGAVLGEGGDQSLLELLRALRDGSSCFSAGRSTCIYFLFPPKN